MIIKEFKQAVNQAMNAGHMESIVNILNLLDSYSNESGINIYDVRGQILDMLNEAEYWQPENNDLQMVNLLCKQLKSI